MDEKRTEWNSNFSFLIAMIGAAVGLGNIWRFPYVLYSNGGGTFFIPYLIALVFLGLFYLFLEYAIGYNFKSTVFMAFSKVKSSFQPIGWAICLLIFLVTTYYLCIVGWDLIYFLLSFTKAWGTNPDAFFVSGVLHSDSATFTIVPGVLISVILIWALVWLISHRDLNDGIGRFTKICVPLLVVLVAVIVIYSLTLPGADMGYMAFFTVDWNALTDLNVWLAAFGQILFTLDLGTGVVIAYSSYLPKGSNLTKNACIVLCSNSGFEIFNAIGIFSILGFMAFTSGIPLGSIVSEGTGLAFVAFPHVFNIMGPASAIIGPLFFLCIFIAGLTSAVGMIEPLVSSLARGFEITRKKAATVVCICGALTTVLFATSSGNYLLALFDTFLNNYLLIFLIILEAVVFAWYYNIDRLIDVLNERTIVKIGNWWKAIVKYLIPMVLAILWVSGIFTDLANQNIETIMIEVVLTLVMIVVPLLLDYGVKKVNGKEIV